MHLLSSPNITQAVPFFMVKDMQRSLQFYVDGIGFIISNTWEPRGTIEWCWLQGGGAAIMLQEYRPEAADKIPLTRGAGVSICFMCNDAIELYKKFCANGLSPNEPFVGNGAWDVAITDPDGYNLHFESATDVPEGTRFNSNQT